MAIPLFVHGASQKRVRELVPTVTSFLFQNTAGIDNLDQNSYTFSNVDLGPEHPNRIFLIGLNRFSSTLSTSLTSIGLTVAGQSATYITQSSYPITGSGNDSVSFHTFYVFLPAGLSGNIVFSSTGITSVTVGLSILSFISIDPSNPFDGNYNYQAVGTAGAKTLTAPAYTPIKDSAVAVFCGGTNMTDPTFSANLTKANSLDSRTSDYVAGAYATNLNSVSTTFSSSTTLSAAADTFRMGLVGLK